MQKVPGRRGIAVVTSFVFVPLACGKNRGRGEGAPHLTWPVCLSTGGRVPVCQQHWEWTFRWPGGLGRGRGHFCSCLRIHCECVARSPSPWRAGPGRQLGERPALSNWVPLSGKANGKRWHPWSVQISVTCPAALEGTRRPGPQQAEVWGEGSGSPCWGQKAGGTLGLEGIFML